MRRFIFYCLLFAFQTGYSQGLGKLSVEKIMRDPKWMGTSPSNVFWSHDGKYLLFNWNPDHSASDSVYFISPNNIIPQKTTYSFRNSIIYYNRVEYNRDRSLYVYTFKGDIFLGDVHTGNQKRITQTNESDINPRFSFNDKKIAFTSGLNLFAWDIATGEITQLTDFQPSTPDANTISALTSTSGIRGRTGRGRIENTDDGKKEIVNEQEKFLKEDALENSGVLASRKRKKEETDSMNKLYPQEKKLRTIKIEDKTLHGIDISPNGRFISYRLISPVKNDKNTIVSSFVTESGYTEELQSRTKVGAPHGIQELYLFDKLRDTIYRVKTDSLPGIRDIPDYIKDYPKQQQERTKNPILRQVNFSGVYWSQVTASEVADIRSEDNKDRWIVLIDTTGKLKVLDRQHDEAWIGGPGIGFFGGLNCGWLNETIFWYQTEVSGYSHLYTIDLVSGEKKSLTSGKYEVQNVEVSKNKKYFYITTNEVHPGEKQFYRLPATGGKAERITTMTGSNEVSVSPDDQYIAVLYSYSNKPWELYLQENKPGGKLQQVTYKAESDEFKSYRWRDPEIITFKANDGANVYSRLYKPTDTVQAKRAVIFVHGAGYLQNAHKWWSSYFREYMFNNLLADEGFYVLDIDYRGSAGYGRDWRTAIYRHMGGKDLDDQVDGAGYLVKNFGVDPKRIGLYGGSYGGFITLMAMFTKPGVFSSGAALRPVTDWAHYNHFYTSNILNEPFSDSLAYRRSSPIYFANGLKGHLLICHGMVDLNVHFQDAARLVQRLIELGKDNWEIAPYPVEDHGFVEPSSWTDEYKRVLRLFRGL